MPLPLIPIILATAALGSGIVQGISSAKNAKAEAKALQTQAYEQMSERARQAKKLMQQQKTSFLKSGVYFDSGSPLAVINETYDYMDKDLKAMGKDAQANINNLMRQGKTAFYGSLLKGAVDAGMAFATMGGSEAMQGVGSNLKTNFLSFMQNKTGNYTGGFGGVQYGGNSSDLFS